MVDLLVRNGHVQRLPDPDDRRIVKVALTDSGREMHRTVGRYVGERFQKVLSGLSDEEQKMLLAITRKMESAMKDLAD